MISKIKNLTLALLLSLNTLSALAQKEQLPAKIMGTAVPMIREGLQQSIIDNNVDGELDMLVFPKLTLISAYKKADGTSTYSVQLTSGRLNFRIPNTSSDYSLNSFVSTSSENNDVSTPKEPLIVTGGNCVISEYAYPNHAKTLVVECFDLQFDGAEVENNSFVHTN